MSIYTEPKTNMDIVDELLEVIGNWREVIIPRHIKFVDAYLMNNRDLEAAGEEFSFNEQDMLFIFWRVQKSLQEEYEQRILKGEIKKKLYIFKTNKISIKKTVGLNSECTCKIINIFER